MKYEKFTTILNKKIFEESKSKLFEKISQNPNRFIGLFRPTKPKAKILQNLTQSNEIKFGDAFEVLIEEYLKEKNFEMLEKNFLKEKLNLDQHFKKDNKFYFVEQKIRDDHDSTKKRGQIENFDKKLNLLLDKKINEKNLIGIIYFIDSDLSKNKKFYLEKIEEFKKNLGVELHLFYGKEFFNFFGLNWNEVLNYLEKWKCELPDLPEIDFDKDAEKTFEEIKNLSPSTFNKVFSNEEIFQEIILTLFPQKKSFKIIAKLFQRKINRNKI